MLVAEKATALALVAEKLTPSITLLTDAVFALGVAMIFMAEGIPGLGRLLTFQEEVDEARIALDLLRGEIDALIASERPLGPIIRPTPRPDLLAKHGFGEAIPVVEDLDVGLLDLSKAFKSTSTLAKELGERVVGIATKMITTAEIADTMRERFSAGLVPAMKALADVVTISRAEIDSLAELMIFKFGEDAAIAGAEALRGMSIEGANLNAVLDSVGEKLQGVTDITREQAAQMTAVATALKIALTEAFVTMGEEIGLALAGIEGGMGSLAGAVQKIIGTMMQTIGRALIAIGTAKIAALSLNPFAAVAAGIALVAAGTALAASAGPVGALAGGAGFGGGGFASIPPPPAFQDGQRQITINIIVRDLDRGGAERIIDQINATEQLDRPVRIDTTLVRI